MSMRCNFGRVVLRSRLWLSRQKKRLFIAIVFSALVLLALRFLGLLATFDKTENMDFPNIGDFSCPKSEVKGKCAFTMKRFGRSGDRGKYMCGMMGTKCKAFVYNSGTNVVILKNAIGDFPEYSPGMVLYIKTEYSSSVNFTTEECAAGLTQRIQASSSFVSGMACNLPKLDPFDKAVMPLIMDSGDLKCGPQKLVTELKNGFLIFHPEGNKVQEVTYQTIIRKNGDFGHGVGKEGKLTRTRNTVALNHDAVRVFFYNDQGQKQTDFHIEVSPLPHVNSRGTKTPGIPLNILIIAFDSTSRSHFIRKLPQVRSFLEKELVTYSFKGYSTLGDGTTPAMIGMLVGKLEEELPEARRSRGGVHVDVWPFIFDSLHEHGYVSMWSEDQARYGTFQYRLHGFKKQPVDHFLRSFWVAGAEFTDGEASLCLGSEPAFKKRFRYMESFYKGYPKTRKFSLEFLAIGHDDINHLGYVEKDFVAFLTNMKKDGHLDNTMVIVMGDHGIRYGAVRSTIIGKLEERLPHLSISVPAWFKKKYPDIDKALKQNTERLTSPFDLHATLYHLLQYPKKPTVDVGQSLFMEVPKSRTCKQAGIPVHYCTCMDWELVSSNHRHVLLLGQAAVQHINEVISREGLTHKCAMLEFKGIHNAVHMAPNDHVQLFGGSDDSYDRLIFKGHRPKGICNYQIQLLTSPNKGIFEVTGYVSNRKPYVNPQMSRIDAYGDQPKCIMESHPHMREYCYCLHTQGKTKEI